MQEIFYKKKTYNILRTVQTKMQKHAFFLYYKIYLILDRRSVTGLKKISNTSHTSAFKDYFAKQLSASTLFALSSILRSRRDSVCSLFIYRDLFEHLFLILRSALDISVFTHGIITNYAKHLVNQKQNIITFN